MKIYDFKKKVKKLFVEDNRWENRRFMLKFVELFMYRIHTRRRCEVAAWTDPVLSSFKPGTNRLKSESLKNADLQDGWNWSKLWEYFMQKRNCFYVCITIRGKGDLWAIHVKYLDGNLDCNFRGWFWILQLLSFFSREWCQGSAIPGRQTEYQKYF